MKEEELMYSLGTTWKTKKRRSKQIHFKPKLSLFPCFLPNSCEESAYYSGISWKTKKPRFNIVNSFPPKFHNFFERENMISTQPPSLLIVNNMNDASLSQPQFLHQSFEIAPIEFRLMGVTDSWTIKKVLKPSDFNKQQTRLLVPKKSVKEHVLPFLTRDSYDQLRSKEGLNVEFHDKDTNSTHGLIFKYWKSSKCYVFINNWGKEFVRRRNLEVGDEVGIYLHPFSTDFSFTVLKRASASV